MITATLCQSIEKLRTPWLWRRRETRLGARPLAISAAVRPVPQFENLTFVLTIGAPRASWYWNLAAMY
jgi:hypothetical protein